MAAIDHEFLGAEPRLPRLFINAAGDLHRLAPGAGRVDVDLDHAGIGRHLDDVEPRIVRRRIPFDMHRLPALAGDLLDAGDEIEIILQPLDRRQEHAQHIVADFQADRGADMLAADLLLGAILSGRAGRLDTARHLVMRATRALILRSGRSLRLEGCSRR